MMMTARLSEPSSAWLLASEGVDPTSPVLDDGGRGIKRSDADGAANSFLEVLARAGAMSLAVEDDLARRDDPHLGERTCFVDDRVLHWADLGPGTTDGARALRHGASGYPLNAFACRRPASELGLRVQHQLLPPELDSIVDATTAVITSVYDAEAFVSVVFGDVGSDFGNRVP